MNSSCFHDGDAAATLGARNLAILVGVLGIVENRVGLQLESELQQVFKPLSQLLNLSKLMFSPLKWD